MSLVPPMLVMGSLTLHAECSPLAIRTFRTWHRAIFMKHVLELVQKPMGFHLHHLGIRRYRRSRVVVIHIMAAPLWARLPIQPLITAQQHLTVDMIQFHHARYRDRSNSWEHQSCPQQHSRWWVNFPAKCQPTRKRSISARFAISASLDLVLYKPICIVTRAKSHSLVMWKDVVDTFRSLAICEDIRRYTRVKVHRCLVFLTSKTIFQIRDLLQHFVRFMGVYDYYDKAFWEPCNGSKVLVAGVSQYTSAEVVFARICGFVLRDTPSSSFVRYGIKNVRRWRSRYGWNTIHWWSGYYSLPGSG